MCRLIETLIPVLFFVIYFPSLVSDFFKIEIFFWQVSDDTSLKLVPPEASRGYNNKETQCSFKRENPFLTLNINSYLASGIYLPVITLTRK